MAPHHAQAGRRWQARRVEDVLGRERNAVQRPERARPLVVSVGGTRLLDRALRGGEDDRIQARVHGVDVLQMRPDHLER